MNLGTYFSQDSMDRLLIIAGSMGGIFMLCCLGTICYRIRSPSIEEREAEKVRKKSLVSTIKNTTTSHSTIRYNVSKAHIFKSSSNVHDVICRCDFTTYRFDISARTDIFNTIT